MLCKILPFSLPVLERGIALDEYGKNLEDVDIEGKRAETNLLEGKRDLLQLQREIVDDALDTKYKKDSTDPDKLIGSLNILEPKYFGSA